MSPFHTHMYTKNLLLFFFFLASLIILVVLHCSVSVHWERFQEDQRFWTLWGVTVVFIYSSCYGITGCLVFMFSFKAVIANFCFLKIIPNLYTFPGHLCQHWTGNWGRCTSFDESTGTSSDGGKDSNWRSVRFGPAHPHYSWEQGRLHGVPQKLMTRGVKEVLVVVCYSYCQAWERFLFNSCCRCTQLLIYFCNFLGILKLSDIYDSCFKTIRYLWTAAADAHLCLWRLIYSCNFLDVLKLSHIYDSDFKTVRYLSFHHGFIKLIPKVHYCTGRWCSVLETYNACQNGWECTHCCL